jgi:hypothetical protein
MEAGMQHRAAYDSSLDEPELTWFDRKTFTPLPPRMDPELRPEGEGLDRAWRARGWSTDDRA